MKLYEILKSKDLDNTFFSGNEISALNDRISRGTYRGKEKINIKCLAKNIDKKATPEEIIRQLFLFKLMNHYGYPMDRIRVEFPITFGSDTGSKKADIVVLSAEDPTRAYIIVEVKKLNDKKGREQLKSYSNATGAPIAVLTNGVNIDYYHRTEPNLFRPITNIPNAHQLLSDVLYKKITYQDLKINDKIAREKKSLRSLIEEMEDDVLANSGVDDFEEIFKLLFCKLYDEMEGSQDSTYYLKFYHSGESDTVLKDKMIGLFAEAKKTWKGIFEDSNEIELPETPLAICVAALQDIKLFNNNLDVIDDAFEYLMQKSQKSKKGQYFTPRYVIDMCVKMMNPNENEYMIDTAAGSSGFTVHGIFHVWKEIRKNAGLPETDQFTADTKSRPQINYVRDKVFAIDFDKKAVRVSRMLNKIAGDGESNVIKLNTLDYGSWAQEIADREWINNYHDGFERLRKIKPDPKNDDFSKFSFDILMANPPFAGDITKREIIARYELGRKNGRIEAKMSRDILFIERNLNFLKPGGRMAIVLPQGRFNNSTDKYIREFIIKSCRILAVVGLHGNVFKPHTGTKTSVLFVQKWDNILCPKKEDYPIFFATMQKPSKDNSGDKIYLKDENGLNKLDHHGHLIVDHDLFNHDGLTQDGIAEAFIEFAKKEKLSFF